MLPSAADVMENALPSIVQVLTDSGSGSGFIVNESGLVVTNQHVVEGGRIVRVRLGTGRNTYPGEVVERHSSLDLAYIQIDSRLEFTPIAIGDSDEIRAGEEVIAIGFPLGSELGDAATITTGVISAKREDLDFLQTDASLNPGNSGGPLLNGYGYVVGVNTAGIVQTEDARTVSGINFAIPINEVKRQLRTQISPGRPVCNPDNGTLSDTPPAQPPSTITPAPTASLSQTQTPTSTPILPQTTASTSAPIPTPTPTVTIAPTATPNPTATLTPAPTPMLTPTPQALQGHFDEATVPASHDGATAFTLQLYFSEEPSLSFEKVRDDVLRVTNGDVTKARRTHPQGSTPNSRWEITVQPSSNGQVTVTLLATTDCSVDRAVCTSSGKMLSNTASITVVGQ